MDPLKKQLGSAIWKREQWTRPNPYIGIDDSGNTTIRKPSEISDEPIIITRGFGNAIPRILENPTIAKEVLIAATTYGNQDRSINFREKQKSRKRPGVAHMLDSGTARKLISEILETNDNQQKKQKVQEILKIANGNDDSIIAALQDLIEDLGFIVGRPGIAHIGHSKDGKIKLSDYLQEDYGPIPYPHWASELVHSNENDPEISEASAHSALERYQNRPQHTTYSIRESIQASLLFVGADFIDSEEKNQTSKTREIKRRVQMVLEAIDTKPELTVISARPLHSTNPVEAIRLLANGLFEKFPA